MMRALALLRSLVLAQPPGRAAQGAAAPPAPPAPALGAAGARAAPSKDATKEEARRHFLQGVALYEEGNFTAALAEFQAANKHGARRRRCCSTSASPRRRCTATPTPRGRWSGT